MKMFYVCLVVLVTSVFAAGGASAETLYVCPSCNFTSIQDAIDAAFDDDEIIVAPGTYDESITLGKRVVLTGSGPDKTRIIVDGIAITCTSSLSGGEISNFYIQATQYGIYCDTTPRVTIQNNIIDKCSTGIYAKGPMTHLTVVNNNILGSTHDGIYLYTNGKYGGQINKFILLNNIIALNSNYAVYNENADSTILPDGVIYFEITHNDFTSNDTGNCSNSGSNGKISCDDPSNISENPQFVDRFAGNYCLEPTSPCINAGRPGIAYNDPDNSINDMGAYGGPRAIGCFFGGPVVTELSVSPGTVEEGTPVTIRAKGVAR